MFAIAPTASISIIAGNPSPCTESFPANVFTQKTLSGSFTVKNHHLQKLLERKWFLAHPLCQASVEAQTAYYKRRQEWLDDQWRLILANEGSVAALPCLTDDEKAIFRTAFEIDQRWILEHAADRAPYVCQAVSNNLFIMPDADVRDLHFLHFRAWELGIKSLYYLRSKALQRAEVVSHLAGEMPQPVDPVMLRRDYDECLACQ